MKWIALALALAFVLFTVSGCAAPRQSLWQQMGTSLINAGRQMGGR